MNLARLAVAVALSLLSFPQAAKAWTCRTLNKHDSESTQTASTVNHVCVDLGTPIDFWISGHEGHYPAKERKSGYADMTRILCTNGGTNDVVVGALEGHQLELFCLDKPLRGTGTNALDALNAVLTHAGIANGTQVKWISSNSPDTQKFYKSLDVDCSCETEGASGKGESIRFMEFQTSTHPVVKKEKHYSDSDPIRRILFDTCMTHDDFVHISEELVAAGNHKVLPAYLKANEKKTLMLSEMVKELLPGETKWLKEHPTSCK